MQGFPALMNKLLFWVEVLAQELDDLLLLPALDAARTPPSQSLPHNVTRNVGVAHTPDNRLHLLCVRENQFRRGAPLIQHLQAVDFLGMVVDEVLDIWEVPQLS